jgi:hypothetical protein
MPISVTEVGGSGPSVEEGQYDLSLESVEQVAPKEGTDYSAQILLQWRVEGKENPDGSPYLFRDYVNAKWGTPEFHSELRKRVFTMTSGRINKFIEAILADTPGAIDLEWFIGTPILAEIRHKKIQTGRVKAVIANAIVERSNADKLRNDFLASIKALDLELYTRCAAVAGLPLGGAAKAPVTAGARTARPAAPELADDMNSDDEEVPF